MISYIFLLTSSLVFLFPNQEKKLKGEIFFALIFSSFLFANLILGFISLILILFGLSNLPIIILSISISLLIFLIDKKFKNKLCKIRDFLKFEVINFLDFENENWKNKFFTFLIIIFLFLIYLSSFGPIDHPDASSYHVGYPFQYLLKRKFFIDGGLSQGLLGIADYANLAFIQENTIWLIRPLQIINLPILILFLSTKLKNKFFILTFLTVPTFIQWSTIGKPLFLGESSLMAIYLIWENLKTRYSLKLLLMAALCCITFKISALIIIFPIFLRCAFQKINSNNIENLFKEIKYLIFSKEIIFCFIVIFSLIFSRYLITNNFAYPLLIDFFNKDDFQLKQFSEILSSFGRDKFFILNIFIPTKISDLGRSIGPISLILFLFILIKEFKNSILMRNHILLITFSQILFLILFCQGRADYYAAPLVSIIYQSDYLNMTNFRNNLKALFNFSLIFQIFLITIFISFSIFNNFKYLNDFDKAMKVNAYGYNLSRIINKNLAGKSLIKDRNTKLYYSKNYVDIDRFKKCEIKKKSLKKFDPKMDCLENYKVNQIITSPDDPISEDIYNCKIINLVKGSRNFLNRKEKEIKYCTKKNLHK